MKSAFILTLMLMTSARAFAVEKCKFHLPDITKAELVTSGATRDEAQAAAAIRCFDMHDEASIRRSGRSLSNDDQGVTVANACTNIRCG